MSIRSRVALGGLTLAALTLFQPAGAAAGTALSLAVPGAAGYSTATVVAVHAPRPVAPANNPRAAIKAPQFIRTAPASGGATRSAALMPKVHTITSVNQATSPSAGVSNVTSLVTRDQEVAFNNLNVAPPDTQLGAGPNHLVAVVNDMGKIIDRTTAATTLFDLNVFFVVPRTFIASDPKIVYDAPSGRWYLSMLAFDNTTATTNDSYVFLAVSRTPDPTGQWTVYTVLDQHASHLFCDQPHMGFSDDKVAIACDQFGSDGFFQYDEVLVVDKAALVNGTSASEFALTTDHFSMQPVYSTTSSQTVAPGAQSPTSIQYFVWNPGGPGLNGIMAVWGNPATRNVASAQAKITIQPISIPPRAAQPGTTTLIDTGDVRYQSAVFQAGTIWASAGDSCIPNGDTQQRACVRLVQIKVGGFPFLSPDVSVTEDFDIGMFVLGNGDYIYYPAVTMDAAGTTYVSYTESSVVDSPSVLVSDILAAHPGAVDQTLLVQSGAGPYVGPASMAGGSRFGDYSAAAPDPTDGHTVWVAGELAAFEMSHQGDWGTVGATFSVPACSSALLSSMPASPNSPGTSLTFVASAGGCWETPQFQFWKLPPGGSWTVVQDFSAKSTYVWDTSAESLGTYTFGVRARSNGSLAPYEAFASNTTLLVAGCSAVSLAASAASPSRAGSPVSFTASASGPSCANPVYEFWLRPAASSTWQLVQPYGAAGTFNWTTDSAAGDFYIGVHARNGTSSLPFESVASITYTITPAPCSAVSVAATPSSPATAGTQITFTATASGCPNPRYEFWLLPSGSSTWLMVQAYSPSPIYTWNSTGAAPGTERFGVWVRDASSTAAYDAYNSTLYSVTAPTCASVSASASPPSPIAHGAGAHVTFSATASSCSNPNPFYEFWFFNGSSWQMVQGWSTTSTYDWNTTGAPPGTWKFGVWVRDSNSTAIYDAFSPIDYTLT